MTALQELEYASHRGELLYGYEATAEYLGMTPREVRHQAEANGLPIFTMGRRVAVRSASCTSGSTIRRTSTRSRSGRPCTEGGGDMDERRNGARARGAASDRSANDAQHEDSTGWHQDGKSHQPMSRSLKAALAYARLGWRPHPCAPGTKIALLKGWPERATADPATIRKWWDSGNANIAVATGPRSGLLVLDVDGPEGERSLIDLERRYSPLPELYPMQWTGGGRQGWQVSSARRDLCGGRRAIAIPTATLCFQGVIKYMIDGGC